LILVFAGGLIDGKGGLPMTDRFKLPRALSEEADAPSRLRPSHRRIIENLDRWANSSELQPPKLPDIETA
jgi:hypothetical protein